MEMETNTIILDGPYLGYQAMFAMRNLHDDGEAPPTAHIMYAVLSRILAFGQTFRTNRFVICWDSMESNRKAILPSYKEHRGDALTPEQKESRIETKRQMRVLRQEVLPEIGFTNNFCKRGYEADDLIAQACAETIDGDAIIVSADEDLLQLLDARTRIYSPSKHAMVTSAIFQEEYGIYPSNWAMAKAYAGCDTDEVPGVKGVGIKTAIKYITGKLSPTSKAHAAITAPEVAQMVQRNLKLVRLPMAGTPLLQLGLDDFSLPSFKRICRQYEYHSFLETERLAEWERFFRGEFTTKESDVVQKMKVQQRNRAQGPTLL